MGIIIRKMQDRFEGKAEGTCCGLPYDTELASSAGCSIVFWCGESFDDELLQKALDTARRNRDIVSAYATLGQPTKFWNHSDMEADTTAAVTPEPELSDLDKFNYQLLSRLQQDCEYYLGFGNRSTKHLWALDEAEQIEKMKELYAALPQKPEWITLADIEKYEAAMVTNPASSNDS